jgi:N,N'-diacetyllegionaminate synthase
MQVCSVDLSQRVLIIAEAGNNHEGDFAMARELVTTAAEAGADAVKFQTIVPERLVSPADTARVAQLGRFQLSPEQFAELSELATKSGIAFLSTPFDVGLVDVLDRIASAFKIASGDNNFTGLLQSVAAKGKPILLSGGIATIDGLAHSKATIKKVWDGMGIDPGLVILHCIAAYPAPPEQANLNAIRTISDQLGVVAGYSDHTLGNDAAVLSVALGGRVIEKHFTLSNTQSDFRDHQLSADPGELRDLVRRVREAETLLGDGVKRCMPAEEPVAAAARRSISAARNLQAGSVLSPDDLICLRPAGGMEPGNEALLLGRTIKQSLEAGSQFTTDMVD